MPMSVQLDIDAPPSDVGHLCLRHKVEESAFQESIPVDSELPGYSFNPCLLRFTVVRKSSCFIVKRCRKVFALPYVSQVRRLPLAGKNTRSQHPLPNAPK
jgi:hypothetical protein